RALARNLGGDEERWGLAGLLHDLDYEQTKDDPDQHTYTTVEWLRERGDVPDDILHAVHAHAGHAPLESDMDRAIYCADPTTGFIVACALMHPEKKISSLDDRFMKKRFKEKRFAAGADRDQMRSCEAIGFELDEFLRLSRDAMAGISNDLGL
ncbi:HDIG domain-containing protein, partial [bacterium]|nr:HDIG domain-containing protein [bacterium]